MKKFFLGISLLLLSGCTVNYNLEIKDNQIKESIIGEVSKEDISIKEDDTSLNIYYSMIYDEQMALIDGNDVYVKDIKEENDILRYNYYYTYKGNYNKSRILNTCFKDPIIKETDELYYINIEGPFFCKYADKINVNVTSNYAVIENNAQKVDGNTYTWIIDDEDNVNIYLTISKNADYVKNSSSKKISMFRLIAFIILIILSGVAYFLYRKKNSSEI